MSCSDILTCQVHDVEHYGGLPIDSDEGQEQMQKAQFAIEISWKDVRIAQQRFLWDCWRSVPTRCGTTKKVLN
jgi:hypothetical protein